MDRISRVVALATYYLFARYLPPSNVIGGQVFRDFRAGLFRRFAKRIGKRVDISRGVYVGAGRQLEMDDDSSLGIGVELHGPVKIGKHVMLSPWVLIHTENHRFRDPMVPVGHQGYSRPKSVVIGDDVWVGARCIILPGVSIGAGSVIGAGAVLRESVPEMSIVAGNPAQIVGSRGDLPR